MAATVLRIQHLFRPMALAVALTAQPTALAASAPKTSVPALTLETVLEAFDRTASLAPVERSLNERAAAQTETDSQRFPGPLSIGLRGDAGRGGTKEPMRMGTVEAVVKRRIALGIEEGAVASRYAAEAQADLLSLQGSRREQALEVAKLYSQLVQRQATARVTKAAVDDLAKIISGAARAARSGTLGAFLAIRWQLMYDGMKADLVAARSAYDISSDALGRICGLPLSRNPFGAVAAPLSDKYLVAAFDGSANFAARESQARQRALASAATATGGLGEMEGGLGVSKDFTGKSTSVIVEVDLPLGTRSAAASSVRSLDVQQAALKATADFQLARARDRFELLAANAKRVRGASRIAAARVADLEALYRKANKAFARGQGDASEVIETARELYEARLKLVDINQERDEAVLTLYFFAKGDAR